MTRNDRRRFLISGVAALGAASLPLSMEAGTRKSTSSLVPTEPVTAPNYWCTWAAQNYLFGQGAKELDTALLEGGRGGQIAHEQLNERVLLNWASQFHAAVRDELYLLMDDGWEEGGTATFQLDRSKFPSFTGSPDERLRQLNEAVRVHGWRALALWCHGTPGGAADEELVRWSKVAGITYWKIDGGDALGSLARARARQRAPLTLEHINGETPLNGDWSGEGRFGPQSWDSPRIRILRQTDVYRTYDTTAILGVPTTLDRAAEMLRGTSGHSEVHGLLNLEDEVYIAAVLGCCMGVMRHPMRGLRPGGDADVFFPSTRNLKQRMDEVVRAIRWQRIAPPYAAGRGSVALDTSILTDDWIFRRGETFYVEALDHHVKQGAPARIGRNMDLPDVRCEGIRPFVLCAHFPGGAAAIGSLERVSVDKGVVQPRGDIRWNVRNTDGPFGIFGHFGTLTVALDRPVKRGRIWAQDLAGDVLIDITSLVRVKGSEIVLPGGLIDRVGLSAATQGDLSAPGMVVEL